MPRKNRLGNAAPKRSRGSRPNKATKLGSPGTKLARTPVTKRARPMSSR